MRIASLLATIALCVAIPTAAFADQYAWNDHDVAMKGAAMLAKGRRFIQYCEPCKGGHREPAVEITTKTVVRKASTRYAKDTYYEVVVNGEAVDLAYIFVELEPGSNKFANVAVALGLEPRGVSGQLTE